MKKQKLQEIYPTSSMHAYPTNDSSYLSIAMEHGFLWVPKKSLSHTEKQLLQAIHTSNITDIPISNKQHPWYASLFSSQPLPKDEGAFRLIQIESQALEESTLRALQEEMSTILPHAVDLFFLSRNYAIIVEAFSEDALDSKELEGLFLALDSDFNSYTRLFSGAFHSFNNDFTRLLHEEEQLFLYLLEHNTQTKVFDTGTAAVPFFAFYNVSQSYLMQSLFEEWIDSELIQIILALWKMQGNISSAAKELFMHRNTLQYKVDKFQQQTLLNLKKMDDLFLCYLLIQTFNQ
ncbi:helix-turn-helix domain-containing protein [Tetragenococcus solitarius]|uniref:Helix-turn-helix domain-containing protein n=1 Tax=Tetragenococcus solitarius TaxID=71453 RepID=A0ABN3Y036_9ENTE|nr:helix-turn-helix domain-containing protein [Tetragenococcus solitarius]